MFSIERANIDNRYGGSKWREEDRSILTLYRRRITVALNSHIEIDFIDTPLHFLHSRFFPFTIRFFPLSFSLSILFLLF